MAEANMETVLKECELKDCPPQLCQVLLTASCLACPYDPIQFLKDTLIAFQGHCILKDVDWHKFVAYTEELVAKSRLRRRIFYPDLEDDMMCISLTEKALDFYIKNLTSICFRKWKSFVAHRKSTPVELAGKTDMAQKHCEKKCQQVALTRWLILVKLHKKRKTDAVKKLETLITSARLRRIMAGWRHVTQESKRTKEYFKKLEMRFNENSNMDHRTGKGCDGLLLLPDSLLLKIFQYLEVRDWLNCAEVCCTWKSVIHSRNLWSQVNISVEKDWITDKTMKEILQNFRISIIHLNLRGCMSLHWPSLKFISECRNLQELNLSECPNITDLMIQRIAEGCPCMLYLNLSCTLITNKALKELSRNSLNLQYLSLAYCSNLTDKGFIYLSLEKGCRNLIHLNVSGCTQMTENGFRSISTGCPSLKQIVINDMPTLSDSCVMALLARCRCLSDICLLDATHLSDIAFKAISEAANLTSFSTEGNNQVTDVSWKALCSSSPGLRRLHAAQCPRMTDAGLKSVATLKNLHCLDISLCCRVTDVGIQYLTEGASAAKLQELNVSQCSYITDISVMRIAQRLCQLYHLNLSYCERLTNSAMEWLSCSSICSLDFSGCNIQDQGLANLEGIRLKKLVLAECVCITDIGIERLCKNVRDLEHVNISHCVTLSDVAVRAFSFYCKGLVTLRMSWCLKMTDMAVQYLTCGSPYLRELDVSGCVLLTDRAVKLLDRICPPLNSITMVYCCGISRSAALKLQQRVSYWEHSNDKPPYWIHNGPNSQ